MLHLLDHFMKYGNVPWVILQNSIADVEVMITKCPVLLYIRKQLPYLLVLDGCEKSFPSIKTLLIDI